MRALWKKDAVISLKLKDDLYSLAQMLTSPFMRFYAISNREDIWNKTDLNIVKPLFCVPIGNALIKRLGVRHIPATEVTPSQAPFERYFIMPHVNYEGPYVFSGGKLIDLGTDAQEDVTRAPVIIPNLTVREHCDVILRHELTGMWGDKDTTARLIHFFETGVDYNGFKEAVFPDLMEINQGINRDIETYRTIKRIYATKPRI